MGLLSDLIPVADVATAVELLDDDVLDFEHLELDDGRDFLVAVATGSKAERVARQLERLRYWSQPGAGDAAVVAHTNDEQVLHIIELLQEWHRTRIEKLELVANASPDVKIEARGPDGQPLELAGQLRAGFQEGVNLALQMLKNFPLTVADDAEDSDEEQPL